MGAATRGVLGAVAVGGLILGAAAGHADLARAQDADESGLVVTAPEGEVSPAQGLAAWDRIYAVTSHPRCSNCHVDDAGVPMWSGPSYGDARPHGMNIVAGASRIGAATLPCATCHATSTLPNETPHAAPHAGNAWRLPPAAFAWFGEPSAEVCAQMRDPERNGGRDGDALVAHLLHDADNHAFITWGFTPGGGREPAPGTMQEHLDAMVTWTAAGMPCPDG